MDSSIVIQNELNISSCSYMPWGKEPSEKVTGRQSPGEFMHGGYRPEHVGLGKRQSLGSAPTQHSYYTYPRQGHQGYGHQLYVPYGPQALNGMAESDPQYSTACVPGPLARVPQGEYSTGWVDDMQQRLQSILDQQGLPKGKYVMIPPVVLPLGTSDLPGERQYDIIGQLLSQLADVRKREGTPSLPSVINILIDLYRRIRMYDDNRVYRRNRKERRQCLPLAQIEPMVNEYCTQLGLMIFRANGHHRTVKNQLVSIFMQLELYKFETGLKPLITSGTEKTYPYNFSEMLNTVTKDQYYLIDKYLICSDVEYILFNNWFKRDNVPDTHLYAIPIPRYAEYEEFQRAHHEYRELLRTTSTKGGNYESLHEDICKRSIENNFDLLQKMNACK